MNNFHTIMTTGNVVMLETHLHWLIRATTLARSVYVFTTTLAQLNSQSWTTVERFNCWSAYHDRQWCIIMSSPRWHLIITIQICKLHIFQILHIRHTHPRSSKFDDDEVTKWKLWKSEFPHFHCQILTQHEIYKISQFL